MRYFYDTEFIDNGKTIPMISIGIIADDGRSYYAVNKEIPQQHIWANTWLGTHVWPHLPTIDNLGQELDYNHPTVKAPALIAHEVHQFLTATGFDNELWSYYSAYDHVVLCQLYGPMIDLPSGIPARTNDLTQEIERRGTFTLPHDPDRHHALADAGWIRDVWHSLHATADGASGGNVDMYEKHRPRLLKAMADGQWYGSYELTVATETRSAPIYALLSRFLEEGLTEDTWGSEKKPRRYYRLTAAGKRATGMLN